jgi:hypothetical protein
MADASQREWLKTALAVRSGDKHKDLGNYKTQTSGRSLNWEAYANR